MDEIEDTTQSTPIWAIFGDLMSGLVGVFVLLLVWVIGYQLELAKSLEEETLKRQQEEQRRIALEEALADPLASGSVTIRDGKIGISGSVLFALNSDQLQREGRDLLRALVAPLTVYLAERQEMLMVSGFTDDLPVRRDNQRFADNWELSAQRSLTVTRVLIEEGMSPERVFAAAFGSQRPVVPNVDAASRSQNRRVEISPVPMSASNNAASQ
ncbi:MAG: OmpA family protein [Pseudomonadota bacterium]